MKEKKINKPLLIKLCSVLACLVVLLSCLTVSAFAADDDLISPGNYRWSEDPDFYLLTSYSYPCNFYFLTPSGNYSYCFDMNFSYRGYWVISLQTSDGLVDVYNDGWVDDCYRYVFFNSSFDPGDNYDFFVTYLIPVQEMPDPEFGIYPSLYVTLQQYIYGDLPLTSDMRLTLTFISTIGCLFVVFVPFLVVYFFLKIIRFL